MEKPASLICLLCFLIYCGPKQDQVEKTIEDGVEVVINHLEPYEIKGEPGNLILEEMFAIDTEKDEIAEMGLIDIETFDVDSKGNIYLMLRQTSENFIYKFDNKGSFITSFCRKGQGPGEASWGGDILIDEYDRVIAKDMTKQKFFIFDPDGTLVEEIKMGKNFSLIDYLGEDMFLIWSQEVEGEDRMFQNRFGIADGTFEKIKIIYNFEFQDSQLAERYTPVSRGFVLGFSKNSFFIGNSRDKYEIHVYDGEGNLVRKIRKDYIPIDISDDYKRIIKKRLESIPAG